MSDKHIHFNDAFTKVQNLMKSGLKHITRSSMTDVRSDTTPINAKSSKLKHPEPDDVLAVIKRIWMNKNEADL